MPGQGRAKNAALGEKEMEVLFREHLVGLAASAIADYRSLLNEVWNLLNTASQTLNTKCIPFSVVQLLASVSFSPK